MSNTIYEIHPGKILARYIFFRLENNFTAPIEAKPFMQMITKYVAELNEKANGYEFILLTSPFKFVVEFANNILEAKKDKPAVIYVPGDDNSDELAIPTYNLEFKGQLCYDHTDTRRLKEIFMSQIPDEHFYICDRYSKDETSVPRLAKKVAAVYINDLIQRYVEDAVSDHRWPKQCKDIDKYIFEKDLAWTIEEPATRSVMGALYYHAIGVVTELLENAKEGEKIIFSNREKDALAYCNFKKFLLPDIFRFLRRFHHNQYRLRDDHIVVMIESDKALLIKNTCIFSDQFDDDDVWSKESRELDDREVDIMEKRLW